MQRFALALVGIASLSSHLAFAQSDSPAMPTQIVEILRYPLAVFQTADVDRDRLVGQFKKDELKSKPPWVIHDQSANGMYLVEFDGVRGWVIDSTVKVDFSATAGSSSAAIGSEAVNFSDSDLAGSRGYGKGSTP